MANKTSLGRKVVHVVGGPHDGGQVINVLDEWLTTQFMRRSPNEYSRYAACCTERSQDFTARYALTGDGPQARYHFVGWH